MRIATNVFVCLGVFLLAATPALARMNYNVVDKCSDLDGTKCSPAGSTTECLKTTTTTGSNPEGATCCDMHCITVEGTSDSYWNGPYDCKAC